MATEKQMFVLKALMEWRHPTFQNKDIALVTGLKPSAIAYDLTQYENKGFLERDARDPRVWHFVDDKKGLIERYTKGTPTELRHAREVTPFSKARLDNLKEMVDQYVWLRILGIKAPRFKEALNEVLETARSEISNEQIYMHSKRISEKWAARKLRNVDLTEVLTNLLPEDFQSRLDERIEEVLGSDEAPKPTNKTFLALLNVEDDELTKVRAKKKKSKDLPEFEGKIWVQMKNNWKMLMSEDEQKKFCPWCLVELTRFDNCSTCHGDPYPDEMLYMNDKRKRPWMDGFIEIGDRVDNKELSNE